MTSTTAELTRLCEMIVNQDWLGAERFCADMRRILGQKQYQKYSQAVTRVEGHFTAQTRLSPWYTEWADTTINKKRVEIASIIAACGGVAPLIDDITDAVKTNKRPGTLIYFLVSDKGERPSRWDLLVERVRSARWDAAKAAENKTSIALNPTIASTKTTPKQLSKAEWEALTPAERINAHAASTTELTVASLLANLMSLREQSANV